MKSLKLVVNTPLRQVTLTKTVIHNHDFHHFVQTLRRAQPEINTRRVTFEDVSDFLRFGRR